MTIKLENYLETLKRSNALVDWRCTPGYGASEYTLEFEKVRATNIMPVATHIKTTFKARDFTKHNDGALLAVKFVITH
jgi:hypothetical protein